MADAIDKVPEGARWEIATKGLTGAYIAISNALIQGVGQKKFEEFNGPFWKEAGKGAKGFADAFGLPTKTAADTNAVATAMVQASMGPEFVSEVKEATEDRCVATTTHCPWYNRWKEQGVKADTCGVGHQNFGEGVAASLNPDFTFQLTKNMLHGDPYCEWVVERKK